LSTPQEEYEVRLKARTARLRTLQRRDRWLSEARLLVFALGLALIWAVFGVPRWPGALLALPVIGFGALLVAHERTARALRRAAAAARFYEDGIARIEDRWAGRGLTGEDFRPQDHVYAEDLDLFGSASLFELLCTARTRAGERALAECLSRPADAAELLPRQAAIAELTAAPDFRERVNIAGSALRPRWHPQVVEAWATAPRRMPRPAWWWMATVLSALPLASAWVGWQIGGLGWGFLILGALPGLAVQRSMRETLSAVLHADGAALRELSDFSHIARCVEAAPIHSEALLGLRNALSAGGGTASRAISLLARMIEWKDLRGNPMFAPIALALLWEVHFAYALEWWRGRFGVRVPAWLRAVGEFEALCALATYAYEHPQDPFPEFVAGPARFDGEALGHPLLPAAACVRNTVRLGDAPRLLIVSGSNMSGKSTLLRTVGVNAVLAMAGAPVRAASLRLSPLHVAASMHITDSIQSGTSHFYAEILRLKAIQDLTRGPRPVLFLIDEILHGTNSHDRSAGAEAVLRGLVETGAIGLVTTHDLALTAIARGLGDRAANVHFEDHLEGGRLAFDYTMRAGVVQRSNAVALMRQIGLDV
jgi:hypothetical protein